MSDFDLVSSSTEYSQLIDSIGNALNDARNNLAQTVNVVMVDAYWQVGQQIVEFEQKGNTRAAYGENLLPRLSKDLTLRYGKGFNRSNLIYMRKLYLTYPKRGTLSHKLTWSHYYEILKLDDPLEINFYAKETEKEHWSVRELKRQMKSMLFHRLALSKEKRRCASSCSKRYRDTEGRRYYQGSARAGICGNSAKRHAVGKRH